MPIEITITADELKELLAEREADRALREEQEALRGALRLVTAERDFSEDRLRAYRRELFDAKSEARGSDQLGLFNEAEALSAKYGRLGRHSGDDSWYVPAQAAWASQTARSESAARGLAK